MSRNNRFKYSLLVTLLFYLELGEVASVKKIQITILAARDQFSSITCLDYILLNLLEGCLLQNVHLKSYPCQLCPLIWQLSVSISSSLPSTPFISVSFSATISDCT